MASTTSPTAMLCHWVCSTAYGDLPVEVRQETVTLLYDQVGCSTVVIWSGYIAHAGTMPRCLANNCAKTWSTLTPRDHWS